MIIIKVRDINGNRRDVECSSESDAISNINDGFINGDDEILVVIQDNICLYSALGADHPITIDDLTGFFG